VAVESAAFARQLMLMLGFRGPSWRRYNVYTNARPARPIAAPAPFATGPPPGDLISGFQPTSRPPVAKAASTTTAATAAAAVASKVAAVPLSDKGGRRRLACLGEADYQDAEEELLGLEHQAEEAVGGLEGEGWAQGPGYIRVSELPSELHPDLLELIHGGQMGGLGGVAAADAAPAARRWSGASRSGSSSSEGSGGEAMGTSRRRLTQQLDQLDGFRRAWQR
jgi:hypothetical protein